MSEQQQKASSEPLSNPETSSETIDCNGNADTAPENQPESSNDSPWGDRNPNWTEKDLPPRASQESPAASADSSDSPWDDRNPNWTEKGRGGNGKK